MNKFFVEVKIPLEVTRKKGSSAIQKPSLDGPTARAIISVGEKLVEAVRFHMGNKTRKEIFDQTVWLNLNQRLWEEWKWLVEAMSVVNPDRFRPDQVRDFPMHCRRFGVYWRDTYTEDFMKSFYLHTIFFHCPRSWTYVVQERKLSMGMFSTNAMELRHLVIGRPAHKRSLRGGGGGRRRKGENGENLPAESMLKKVGVNPVSYLVLRELLIRDWTETNPLCQTCRSFRRDCKCKQPDFLCFVGARNPAKRRKLTANLHTHGTRTVQHECQFGCGHRTKQYPALLVHEKECFEKCEETPNLNLNRRVLDQITEGGTNVLERTMNDNGSDHEDLCD